MAKRPHSYDVDTVRQAASTRWAEILSRLGSVDESFLDGKHRPCPKCGGRDRFRLFDDDTGGAICNQCFSSQNGDGFAVLQWLTGQDFASSLGAIADYLGVAPSSNGRSRKSSRGKNADPAEHLEFKPWNDTLVKVWCDKKPPLTPNAVKAFGARIARYRKQWMVLSIPVWGPLLTKADPVGWSLYSLSGGTLPKWVGKGQPSEWVKVKLTYGSTSGVIGPVDHLDDRLDSVTHVWKLEGPSDALAVQGILPPTTDADTDTTTTETHIAITNSNGAQQRPDNWICDLIKNKSVFVLHDADRPGQDGATFVGQPDGRQRPGWAPTLAASATECRNIQLPYEIKPVHGRDVRDWLSEGHSWDDLLELAGRADVVYGGGEIAVQPIEADDDPHRLARVNLRRYAAAHSGATLRYWRDEWYVWRGNRYRKIPPAELAAKVNLAIKEEFDRLNIEEQETSTKEVGPAKKVTRTLVANVLEATKGFIVVPAHTELNTWIDQGSRVRNPRNYIAMENGILDMDALLADDDDVMLGHSPSWFSTVCLPYKFDLSAECPKWLGFLDYNLEGDQQIISILQEWAGYLLLPDTGQQAFLVLEGEGANGKSVYMAAIEAMLGVENVSHVPLEVFGDRFSKTQTLGKLANIAPDAGEIERQSEGNLKSFTAGERLMFDRKGISAIEAYPTARLMIGCNNRPRFSDKSDGIWRRMKLLPFNRQVPSSKRIQNMDKPWWWEQSGELPGILLWAIRGLLRLRRQGCFSVSTKSDEAAESYRTEGNPARQFIAEYVVAGGEIECSLLYDRYKKWCSDDGFRPLSSRGFGRELKRRYPLLERSRVMLRGHRIYHYFGVDYGQKDEF